MEARMKVEEVEELELDPKTNDDNQVKLVEKTSAFQLGPKEGWIIQLENQLPNNDNSWIQRVIQEQADLFAWSATNMPGIDLSFHCHKLVDAKLVAQRKRKIREKTCWAVQQ